MTTARQHSPVECRDAIAGVIGEKNFALRKINGGVIKCSPEDRKIREQWLSCLRQCLRDYDALVAEEQEGAG